MVPVAIKGGNSGMFTKISQNLMNTPLAEGIPMGKSPRQPTEDFSMFCY